MTGISPRAFDGSEAMKVSQPSGQRMSGGHAKTERTAWEVFDEHEHSTRREPSVNGQVKVPAGRQLKVPTPCG